MDASHAFETHGPRCFAPVQKPVRVADIAEDRIDGLNPRGVRSVDHPHACI